MLLGRELTERVAAKLKVSDWFFLNMVGSNMDPYIFATLIEQMDKSWRKSIGNGNIEKIEKLA